MVIAWLFIGKIYWFCKMKPIRHHNAGMVIFYFNYNRLTIRQGINFFIIYNHSHIQYAKQYLLFSADYDIVK